MNPGEAGLSGGWLHSHIGLSAAEKGEDLHTLQGDDSIAAGSIEARGADLLPCAVLAILGVGEPASPWDVLRDLPPSGAPVGPNDGQTRALDGLSA